MTIDINEPRAALLPLPVCALLIAAWNLLEEASDLPHPRHVSVSSSQSIDLQFSPGRSSYRAIARWAAHLLPVRVRLLRPGRGGVGHDRGGQGHLANSAGPGGRPSPGPASQFRNPYLAKSKGDLWHAPRYQRACRWRLPRAPRR
jgi:hypothetical protein